VISTGIADPERLGVGGWSYGGHPDRLRHRHRHALQGGDERRRAPAFTVSFYGTDQYIIQYDNEIGPPWDPKAWETYQKISYPFLHADRIKTPTLFLGGERDFNVPVQAGSRCIRRCAASGIDTQLVIYPNENHGIARPSYQRDRSGALSRLVRQVPEAGAHVDQRAAAQLGNISRQ
jgi:dipeptidyl aminopeptidase/acylaminoacyl peptidase